MAQKESSFRGLINWQTRLNINMIFKRPVDTASREFRVQLEHIYEEEISRRGATGAVQDTSRRIIMAPDFNGYSFFCL